MIQSSLVENVDGGVLLDVTASELNVRAYVVIASVDLSVVEKLVPMSVFESGVQVHVAGLEPDTDITEEIIQILENMSSQDVVVYLCADVLIYGEALAVLGIKH